MLPSASQFRVYLNDIATLDLLATYLLLLLLLLLFIDRIIKSRKMGQTGHVARMGENKSIFKILI